MAQRNGAWMGGRTYLETDGRTTYVIEKMHRSIRYSISLAAGNEEQALAELALFQRDPPAYAERHRKEREVIPDGLTLSETNTQTVLDALKAAGRVERYRRHVADYLTDWAEMLNGRQLDMVQPTEVERLLTKTWDGAHYQRLMALKTFCTYFVERRQLDMRKDPTLGVKVAKSAPAKLKGSKVYGMDYVSKVYAATDTQHARDVLVLRCLAGIHGTEIERVAAGECELTPVEGHALIKGTVKFVHKGRHVQINSLDAQMFAAAQRLAAMKGAPVAKNTQLRAMQRAAKALGEEQHLLPGNLRHCFVTWAKKFGREVKYTNGGVPLASIKAVVGHRSDSKVTSDVYLDDDVPPMIALPLRLHHPKDPPFEGAPANVVSIAS